MEVLLYSALIFSIPFYLCSKHDYYQHPIIHVNHISIPYKNDTIQSIRISNVVGQLFFVSFAWPYILIVIIYEARTKTRTPNTTWKRRRIII